MSERAFLVSASVVILMLFGATGYALSQRIDSDSDVRIVAQRLEDGRVEFGLDQDGERILPQVRYFPADAPVGRWLRSSPLSVDGVQTTVPLATKPSDAFVATHSFTCLDSPTHEGNVFVEFSMDERPGSIGAMLFSAARMMRPDSYYRSGFPLTYLESASLINWFMQCALFHGDNAFARHSEHFAGADNWRMERAHNVAGSSSFMVSGIGEAYLSVGDVGYGVYECSSKISGNVQNGKIAHFSVVSYGVDGERGVLHANSTTSSLAVDSRLNVGTGYFAHVPVGEIFFEVSAAPAGRWEISCR